MEERDQVLDELKVQLSKAQWIMKTNFEKHKRDVQFEIGENVYLKLRPYRQRSVVNQNNVKLAPRCFGPYNIVGKIGKSAYKLKLQDTASIHPVFQVSQLKKAIGDYKVAPIFQQD